MKKLVWLLSILGCLNAVQSASALELDWSGQFRSEFNYIKTYTLDRSETGLDTTRATANGYYIPNGGSNDAQYQTLFLRLQPKLIVNDNISIKTEWWLGDPTYGFYGNGSPYPSDQKQYYSTFNRGAFITAQRYWAEILTDFGTIKVGRAPLQYGLGVVWNSGDDLWSHYESTGDVVSLVSKFGAFSFIPSFVSYSTGNNVGGSCAFSSATGACTPMSGSGGLSDYSIQLKYENLDEDFYAGLNFIRRIGGASQDPNAGTGGAYNGNAGYQWNGNANGANYNTYDVFVSKKLGKLSLAAEVPITTGNVAGVPYSTWALAADADWRVNDPWEFDTKVGHAPGQPSGPSLAPDSYKGYYFNPNYQIALVMFHYAFQNFSGPNTFNNASVTADKLKSPYDNPITDANYLSFAPILHADKWQFHARYTFAKAPETAKAGDAAFWNNWQRQMRTNTVNQDQSSWLGWEMDYGADFQYDQYFIFGLEVGWWFPGQYYAFSNSPTTNATNSVMAGVARIGITF